MLNHKYDFNIFNYYEPSETIRRVGRKCVIRGYEGMDNGYIVDGHGVVAWKRPTHKIKQETF